MFLQEKVSDINRRLKMLEAVSNVVIWGAGVHTGKLFEWTDILSYDIESIVDVNEQKHGNSYFGFTIQNRKKILWNDVGAVVISVFGKEGQIIEMLRNELGFLGEIITLYQSNECVPFYHLYNKDISQVCYLGDYDNWTEAYNACKGYEDSNIINTVIGAVNKVIKGDATWERDGCLFYDRKYVYRICAVILKCAVRNENKGVRVLDIGGALGSTYFQNRDYLTDVKHLEYVVAEQDNFANYGHQYLEDGVLKFIRSTDHWEEQERFDIVLLSASLQYISNYREIMSKIVRANPSYIILDRILVSDRMRICREIVPEQIYESSYPLRIFSEEQIKEFFMPDYKMIEHDVSSVPESPCFIDGRAESRYYVFEYRNRRRVDKNEE